MKKYRKVQVMVVKGWAKDHVGSGVYIPEEDCYYIVVCGTHMVYTSEYVKVRNWEDR